MEPTQVHPSSTSEKNAITTTLYLENNDIVPLDFEDPHRAALEDNPQHAEKLTTKTLLAVFVRYHSSLIEDVLNDLCSLSFSASLRPRLVPLRSSRAFSFQSALNWATLEILPGWSAVSLLPHRSLSPLQAKPAMSLGGVIYSYPAWHFPFSVQ
jgi:hypothetical protein